MIKYKVMNKKDITLNDLSEFTRYQKTTRVKVAKYKSPMVLETTELLEKEIEFVDEWDDQKKKEVCEELIDVNGTVIYAYDSKRIIGFASLNHTVYNDFMNLEFIHLSNEYRGKRIAKELFYMISEIAIKNGAKRLYISAHPSVETMRFYESVGCKPTFDIIKEFYDHEPYDIQLEKELTYSDIMKRRIEDEFKKYDKRTAVVFSKIANKLYKKMPLDEMDYIIVCKSLIQSKIRGHFSIATLLLKRKKSVINASNILFFEQILLNDIQGWGQVDQYCYRVLNPLLNNPIYYHKLEEWSNSNNKDVRRASLVTMIISKGKLTLDYPFEKVIQLVNKLKDDEDYHVRKAVGWVLKCAYLKYKEEVTTYLIQHVGTLDRMIFRYALEHADKTTKSELMKL